MSPRGSNGTGRIHTARSRSRTVESNNTVKTVLEPEDPVIEQWYSDPYERRDPEGPAHFHQRRQNLENALMNQGFSYVRTMPIVNWLMRCNGYYRDFDDRKGREKGGTTRKRKIDQMETPANTSTPRNEIGCHDSSLKRIKTSNKTKNNVIEDNAEIADKVPLTPVLQAIKAPAQIPSDEDLDSLADLFGDETQIPTAIQLQQILGTDVGTQFDLTRSPEKTNQDSPDSIDLEELLEDKVNNNNIDHSKQDKSCVNRKSLAKAIKSRLRFWDIVYGAPPNGQLPDLTLPKRGQVEHGGGAAKNDNNTSLKYEADDSGYVSPFESDQDASSSPAADTSTEIQPEFFWFHTSTPRLILPSKTQNLLPLHHIIFKSAPCDTEDPTFGLYVVPEHEKMTEDEQREWTELNRQKLREQERKEREAAYRRHRVSLDLDLERQNVWEDHVGGGGEDDWRNNHSGNSRGWSGGVGQFSCGYRETWKEIEATRRAKLVETDEGKDSEQAREEITPAE